MDKLSKLLLVIFGVRDLLAISPIRLCHLTERRLRKPAVKHPLNGTALQQQLNRRVKGAYQSLNCCLTALQHKSNLIEKMADKPCEILQPQGEHRSTLLWGGGLLSVVAAAAMQFCLHFFNIVFLGFSFFSVNSLMDRRRMLHNRGSILLLKLSKTHSLFI